MKKLFFVIALVLLFFIFFNNKKIEPKKEEKKQPITEKRAIFISYIELQKYLKGKDETEAKQNINTMINNINNLSFNMIILQVRSFSDAIYPSKLYPWSKTISQEEGLPYSFDVLDYFIKKSHNKNIELHAWINPYRVRTTNNIEDLSTSNKALEWLNTNNIYSSKDGIYYNPASSDVQKLILDGILEILENYKVDGIHFDDYFYPNLEIDQESYKEYIKENPDISIEDYHLLMVNNLVKEIHKLTKKYNVEFGISPEGNIDNNYSKNQADVYTWGSSKDYVDYLMPQIYYGFYHEVKPFYEVVKEWENISKKSNVKILPALAFYKINKKDMYAKSGENEWMEKDDIIMRQILVSRNIKNYDGFSIFRYDYLFQEEQTELVNKEIKNLKKILTN